jgi:hypothetical protein
MSAGSREVQEIPVDVLPPLPKDAQTGGASTANQAAPEHTVPFEGLRTFYHPASGVAILMLDWFAFGTDFFSGFLALPVICVLAFVVSFPLVFVIQRKWIKDTATAALGKAFLGAFMVGLPFPITGTMLGAAILALSGLPHHPIEMVKKLASASQATPPR